MKNHFLVFFLFSSFLHSGIRAQELFPNNDPASNVGKNVLAVRASSEFFEDAGQTRSFQAYKFMFGLSSKWMLTETFSFSNHHSPRLPDGFIQHDPLGNPYTDGVKRGSPYPYLFESLDVNIKYRFLSHDSEHKHFRMAAYLDLAGGNEAHYEAEPELIGDNGGAGAGLIATLLLHKFAASINTGGIVPSDYTDAFSGVVISYGKAAYLNLSLGYLVYPGTYRSYNQTNINLYAEFQCKAYDGMVISENGKEVMIQNVPALESGSYVEFRPSVQFIIRSNTRIDLCVATHIYNRSWAHNDPAFFFTLQQSIFFKSKS